MQVTFYRGWPLRYAHVVVGGLHTEHAASGTICLWAEDDPAQIAARDLSVLWARLDEWAATAQHGFGVEDRALDAYLLFADRASYDAELPFGDLIRQGSNGYRAKLHASLRGRALMITAGEPEQQSDPKEPQLRGAFYLRRDIGTPPRKLEDIRAALTRRQKDDLDRGLSNRNPVGVAEASEGYDFIVLAWPRHDAEHDAVVVCFDGQGETLRTFAVAATANDIQARKRRAGPDMEVLQDKTVLLAGAGSVGGHVAVALAASGVGTINLHDSDYLKTGNLVRHVCTEYLVGYKKTTGVSLAIENHAPWTTVKNHGDLSPDPSELAQSIEGADLVVDCTGVFWQSAALAEICRRHEVPLIIGALFHQGAIARIQRQTPSDTPIAARHNNDRYTVLPPEDPAAPEKGFLELGCTSPINNASPTAVLSVAAEIAHVAIDYLTDRCNRSDERIIVFQPMDAPFDKTGTLDAPIVGDA